ncbi:MAG: M20 family metallopeptidase [Acidimicrobiales bacterium]|nr:M20 family metallopeptidase [Acidimicrobiales bacterium]
MDTRNDHGFSEEVVTAARRRICARVDELAEVLIATSHAIHAEPELCFEEHVAHDLLSSVLKDEGLAVERSAYGLATAFQADVGVEGPMVAVLCEYDALPGIGHACGHNVIAAAGLGAGLAAAAVAAELGGRVRILGTPAEEGGGGKVVMAERGAFEGLAAALMVHPADADLENITSLAIQQVQVTYHGRAAHAAAAPEKGLNALDAMVLGYMNVAALRQHIAPDERIHGIFTESGDKANIVPRRTAASWYTRSPSRSGLEALNRRVVACLEAGAVAAGCDMEIKWVQPSYDEVVDNRVLLDRYIANAAEVGRDVRPSLDHQVVGSTDMGNVSYLVPAIHPMIKVAPVGTAIHTEDFAACSVSDEADRAVLDGAKVMALTMADCWTDPSVLEAARLEFAGS